MERVQSISTRYLKLWETLEHTKDAISKLRQQELKQFNISPEQTGILNILVNRNNNPTPTEISRMMFKDCTSISIILNKMAKKDLIKKSQDPKRKNVVRISISNNGQKIYNKAIEKICMHTIMSKLTEKECRQLQTILNKLLNEVESNQIIVK
jgi:MarR family transcriptional regulator, organic hydroperoxide resistance regulator